MTPELYDLLPLILKLNINIITIYLTHKTLKKYEIKKIYNQKRITKVSISPELKQKYTDVKLNEINNEFLKESILEFIKLLVSKFPEEALVNFYNNINELTIKENHIIKLIGAEGCYFPKTNSIIVSDSTSIYHELFHMASRSYDKETKKTYTGFSQKFLTLSKIFYESIGDGINEGYTELLANRYFGSKHGQITSYEFEADIVKKLETIIGEEKMTSLYLKGNLMGLIKEIKKYMPEEDILKFITRLDLINKYDSFHKSIIIRESIFDTYEFLLKTNALKLKKQYEAGLIDLNTFKTLSNNYFNLFKDEVYISNFKYNLKNLEEMYNIILKNIDAPECISKHSKR